MKKHQAGLEKKRPLFFLVGILVALSATLVSFEWRTPITFFPTEQPYQWTTDGPIRIPVTIVPDPEQKVERPEPPKQEQQTVTPTDEPVKTTTEPLFDPSELTVAGDGLDISLPDEGDEPDEPTGPHDVVSVMPEFCAGERAMMQLLANELNYPDVPRRNGVSGTVYVQFVVDRNGNVQDPKIIRPIDPWLDAEALRVVKLLDCFIPGKQNGQTVDVFYRLPVRFSLQ